MTQKWRIPVAAGVAVLVLAAGLLLWQRSDDSSSDTATTGGGDSTAEITASYGIGRREVTFVDASRPTAELPDAGIPAAADRTLETVVLYPTDDTSDDLAVDATAAGGTFRL